MYTYLGPAGKHDKLMADIQKKANQTGQNQILHLDGIPKMVIKPVPGYPEVLRKTSVVAQNVPIPSHHFSTMTPPSTIPSSSRPQEGVRKRSRSRETSVSQSQRSHRSRRSSRSRYE